MTGGAQDFCPPEPCGTTLSPERWDCRPHLIEEPQPHARLPPTLLDQRRLARGHRIASGSRTVRRKPELGLAQFLTVGAALSLFAVSWVMALVFGVYHEIGHRGPRLVRIGLATTVVVMAVFGLTDVRGLRSARGGRGGDNLANRYAPAGAVPGPRGRATTTPPAPRVLMDQEMVDREFDDIVAGLGEMDDQLP